METIKAHLFFRKFKEMMAETNLYEGETYLSLYKLEKSKSCDPFTKFINKELIPKLIQELSSASLSHEYFRIDTAGWVSYADEIQDEAQQVGMKNHLWDLTIAVEHENNYTDWNDEVIKLAHIRCPLKVVIGYNCCDQRDEGDLTKLSFVASCLQKLRCFNDDHHDELLVILGNRSGKHGQDYNTFDYRGYLYSYNKKAFCRIES